VKKLENWSIFDQIKSQRRTTEHDPSPAFKDHKCVTSSRLIMVYILIDLQKQICNMSQISPPTDSLTTPAKCNNKKISFETLFYPLVAYKN